jgi:hypothetical protein
LDFERNCFAVFAIGMIRIKMRICYM